MRNESRITLPRSLKQPVGIVTEEAVGWFSKSVPQRRWTDVSVALARKLQAAGDSWYSTFQQGTAPHGLRLSGATLSHSARHYVSMMQLSAVAATLQANRYVSDVTFFLEHVYIVLTRNPAAGLHDDIEMMPFATAGNAQN